MRYRLATYRECKAHREWNTTCPECGRRGKFSPYIDTATMQPVDDHRCGRCNRLSNCGYHLPPKEWFKDNPPEKREWLPREQYIELMRQRRKEATEIRKQSTDSPSVYRGSTAEPGGSSKRSAEQDDTTRSACNAPALTGTPSISRGGVADSPIAESDTAKRLTQKNCPSETGGRAECSVNETKRRGYEVNESYEKMHRAMQQSQPWGHHLATWLRTKFPREQVDAALKRYRVGGTPDGTTLWWQIDEQGRVHTGKAMQYNPLTGHRVKEQGFPVNWAHRMRLYGEPSELVVPQCLFGLHLINENCYPLRTTCSSPLKRDSAESTEYMTNQKELSPFKGDERREQSEQSGGGKDKSSLTLQTATPPVVRLVESEKTALIMSLVCPDTVWLATGGKANFKEQMLWPLLGHEVAVYPDADALRDWELRIHRLNRELGHRLYIPTGYYNLMNHEEARRKGWDLADVTLSY